MIKEDILFKAVVRALHDYPEYRVRLGNGVFWSYLEFNDKAPKVEVESDMPCNINLRKNNDYLFLLSNLLSSIFLQISFFQQYYDFCQSSDAATHR